MHKAIKMKSNNRIELYYFFELLILIIYVILYGNHG